VYIPSLESGVADGIYDIIDGIVGDIYKQASMIQRLATHSGQEHYQVSSCSNIQGGSVVRTSVCGRRPLLDLYPIYGRQVTTLLRIQFSLWAYQIGLLSLPSLWGR